MQFELLAGAPVVDTLEGSRFQQNVAGSVVDFGLCAAHHTGDGDGASRVGDQQHRTVQLARLSIQCCHLFAGAGATYSDCRFGRSRPFHQQVVVKGVEGLAHLQHHIIGDVHDIADGAHPGLAQPLLHPQGRRADGHVPDEGGGVAVTEGRVFNFHGGVVGGGVVAVGLPFVRGQMEGRTGQRVDFPGHAAHTQAAGHIRRQFDLHHIVAQIIRQRDAGRRIQGQKQNALVLLAQSQFQLRADHSCGTDAADFGRFEFLEGAWAFVAIGVHQHRAPAGKGDFEDGQCARCQTLAFVLEEVGRAGNHLLGFSLAVLHIHQHQSVRVRVGFHCDHLADDECLGIPPVPYPLDRGHF